MKKPVIYISGAMTGHPTKNKKLFYAAEKWCLANGYKVVNPHRLDEKRRGKLEGKAKKLQIKDTEWFWCQYLRDDIKHLVKCDEIMMLPGWRDSRGAKLESYIADQLGMKWNYFWYGNMLKENVKEVTQGGGGWC